MNFENYESCALQTVAFDHMKPMHYLLPALAEEVGEVTGLFAKTFRKTGSYELTEKQREELTDELGDVLWNLAMLSLYNGIDFDYVARRNIEKLAEREENDDIATIQR